MSLCVPVCLYLSFSLGCQSIEHFEGPLKVVLGIFVCFDESHLQVICIFPLCLSSRVMLQT